MQATTCFSLVVVLALGMSSSGWAQSNSALLEKGIYAEETLGNLSDAINAYLQIIGHADAARPIAAQALLRLGICYLKSGKRGEAQATFAKLIQLYPEQKELIARIPASPNASELHFLPAPWQDGEVLEFVANTKGEGASGLYVFRVEAAEENGRKAWHFESIGAHEQFNTLCTNVLADADTMTPISADMRGRGIDAHANFTVGRVHIQPSKKGTPGDIPLNGMVYDDSQVFQLVRRLRLTEGLQITIPLIDILSGAVTEIRVSVERREKITVPAGIFDCFRVMVSRGPRGVANEQTVWITADSHAYIAKASFSGDSEIQLTSVHSTPKGTVYEWEDREAGFRSLMPAGWQIYRVPHRDHPNLYFIFDIIPPELKAELSLSVHRADNDPPRANIAEYLESYLVLRGRGLKNYALRMGKDEKRPSVPGQPFPGRCEIIEISGFPACRTIADFLDAGSGEEMVEYSVLFFTHTRMVQLGMRVEKEAFEQLSPMFDFIADNLKFN